MSDSTSEQQLATHPRPGHDAFSPPEVALLVETRGVAKATAPVVTTFVFGLAAEAFIALGAVFSITIGTGSELGFGPTRCSPVSGSRSASDNVGFRRLLANWGVVYLGNAIGALSVVVMVFLAECGEETSSRSA